MSLSDLESAGYLRLRKLSTLEYTSEREDNLKRLYVSGKTNSSRAIMSGVGYKKSGGYALNIRIHGENYMDGRELARIMQELGSPCYGGEYDAEHFLYLAESSGASPLVDSNHANLRSGIFTLEAEAILLESVGVGEVATGIHFMHTSGARSAVTMSSGEPGEVTLSGSSISGGAVTGISHYATATPFRMALRYDTMKLYRTTRPTEGYRGTTIRVQMQEPLYHAYTKTGGLISDSLEVMSGVIQRRIKCQRLGELEIRSAVYEGIPCLMAELPIRASEGAAVLSGSFSYTEDISDLASPGQIFLSPGGDAIYFSPEAEYSTPEAAKAHFLDTGANIAYPRRESLLEKCGAADYRAPRGKSIIEVCSNLSATIEIDYIP